MQNMVRYGELRTSTRRAVFTLRNVLLQHYIRRWIACDSELLTVALASAVRGVSDGLLLNTSKSVPDELFDSDHYALMKGANWYCCGCIAPVLPSQPVISKRCEPVVALRSKWKGKQDNPLGGHRVSAKLWVRREKKFCNLQAVKTIQWRSGYCLEKCVECTGDKHWARALVLLRRAWLARVLQLVVYRSRVATICARRLNSGAPPQPRMHQFDTSRTLVAHANLRPLASFQVCG